jgi:AcrR family transcriptional regulator
MIASREISDDIRNSPTAVALIEAGIEQFGLYGQKATTRNVAEHANANIAAIPYYFRSKNGLYSACMHYVVDEIWLELGKQISDPGLIHEDLSPEQAKQIYLEMMDAFCLFFLQDAKTLRWSQFVMREHASPSEAYEIFYKRYYCHAQQIKGKVLAISLGANAQDEHIKILDHALFGQVLGFLIARESLLRGLGVKDLTPDSIALIRKVVRHNLIAVLGQGIDY